MNINDFQTEEKTRLDPKCWTGKKIGNPKTKMKGGVRVNNCVPAESVAEGSVDHRALGKHHEEMTDQELRKVGSKLPDSWDAVVLRRKLASHPKYAQALKHYNKSEYHFGKAAKQGVAEEKELPQWKKDWYANQKPNSWPKHPQPYHNPDWIDELSPEERKKLIGGKGVAEADDIGYHQTSGTKAGHTISSRKLSNKPQASNSDVTLQSGSMHHRGKSYNFPKGTLFTQLPGGIFAKHPSVPETHPGFGHLIRKSEDNIHAIHSALTGQQGVAEGATEFAGDTEQDQELRNYAQDTADRAREQIKHKMFNMMPPEPKEDDTVHEEHMNPEYDDEAGMADNNLSTLRRAVDGLDDLIDSGDNLPEWCQEKIAVAKSMLVAVWDYMESEDDSEMEDPEIAEMYEAMQELAEAMARRNRVSVDRVWESFEALDDNMLYETAAWRRKEGKSKSGGLNAKGVASYRRENPGSKLQTAVTTKPSKLKPGSKAAKRRKSFCARMSGVKGPMKKPNGKPTRKALALRKWNC